MSIIHIYSVNVFKTYLCYLTYTINVINLSLPYDYPLPHLVSISTILRETNNPPIHAPLLAPGPYNLGVAIMKLYQTSGSYFRAIKCVIAHTFPLNKTSRWYGSNQPMPNITVVSHIWYF